MRRALIALLLSSCLTGSALADDRYGLAAVGLPPLPENRERAYDFYRLQFLPDAYPGRRIKAGKVVPHPIYGTYVIRDYVALYNKTKDSKFLDAAKRVADAALNRMHPVDGFDAVAYYYDPNNGLTNLPGRFYSGLTQARYLTAFSMLHQASGISKYQDAARRIFNSLKVPSSRGGVLVESTYGTTLEEFPHEIPTFVLNGWTTIILELMRYEKATKDPDAAALIKANLASLEKLLPKYDHQGLLLSRYQLTGPTRLKFVFDKPGVCRLSSFATYVDKRRFSARSDAASIWDNHILPAKSGPDGFPEGREVSVNAVFSRIDDRPRYEFGSDCKTAARLQTFAGVSDYNIRHSRMSPDRWVLIDERDLPEGQSVSPVEPESAPLDLIAYPTNFNKNIGGTQYNVYHWLHIRNLDQIAAAADSEILRDWSARWRGYTQEWPKSEAIAQPNVSFDCYPGPCTDGGLGQGDEPE